MFEGYLKLLSDPIELIYFYVFLLFTISFLFFLKDKNDKLFSRVGACLHAGLLGALIGLSIIVDFNQWQSQHWFSLAWVIIALAFFSMIFSLFKFRGQKQWLFFHLVTLFLSPYVLFYAGRAFSGDWL